jgi:uncharacterized Zn-finger protein
MTNTNPSSQKPPTERRITVSRNDLPLHCPMPGAELWSSHPRVYLPIENSGQELCPYCGTLYVLRDDAEQ